MRCKDESENKKCNRDSNYNHPSDILAKNNYSKIKVQINTRTQKLIFHHYYIILSSQ
ncbi:hypothetical protein pb186bvf_019282 [Paramecium bursaria]